MGNLKGESKNVVIDLEYDIFIMGLDYLHVNKVQLVLTINNIEKNHIQFSAK